VEDSAGNFTLDLTDATARAHLAWWLDAAYVPSLACPSEAVFRREGNGWMLDSGPGRGVIGWVPEQLVVAIDPDDARLLPDGSRLADALALSLVARHVAGLEVTP